MIEEKGLFLKIKDKTILDEELFCPLHCFPHKLPFTKPIEREMPHTFIKIKNGASHVILCNNKLPKLFKYDKIL